MLGAMNGRCRGGLRFGFVCRPLLWGRVPVGSGQDRQEKNDTDRDTAGREHPGAAPGTRYLPAPLADQRLDSLLALLLEVVSVPLAQGDRFLPKGCERLGDSRVLCSHGGFRPGVRTKLCICP
jgi:hypothetical protein